MVTDIHRDTWFVVRGDSTPVMTERGTRPGDGFADVLWALVFRRWIAQIEQDLYDLGTFQDHDWNEGIGLHSAPGHVSVKQSIVAWADDVTILGATSEAEQLLPKIQLTAQTMINRLLSYGMTPNMSAGKTEAVVTPRGRNALKVRRHLFNDLQCAIPLETTLGDYACQ